ncbi:hypothetical protein HU200_051521 [Digitaria exilis]|uniref:Uncharacterized protein n=1 Tax=Digitaria exilis TaxID=1010633 RepID=A0A835E4X7_9POAL|nr:hypothetical protein HU200_051521 [Digitaria exilis]
MGFDEGRLEVAAPELRSLCPESHRSLHVAAPNLSELIWHFHDYDPARHQFAEEAGRHLRRLVTSTNRPEAALMRRFDVVDELNVRVSIAKGTEEYERYLEDIKNLSKCQVLVVTLTDIEHPLMPTVLHLLAKCVGTRKLVVDLRFTVRQYVHIYS